MAVKSPRSSEVFSNEKSKAPRVMSPTVIHPMGRGQTAQQKYESNMTMESENNHLLDKVESLEYQLACEQRDKLKMQREIDNLAEKLSRALVGPEPSTQSFELQRQLSMEKSYSEDLKGKLASAGIQIKEQQRLLDSMTETLASLQKENDALRFSVQELEMKLVRAASDDTMSRTMQELYAKCAAMERRLAEVPALERQVSDASRQLEEERSRASKVQRELVEIRRDLARSDHEAQDQRSKAGAATAEVTQLRQELDRQAHRLHEQSRKADAATQDAAAARSELRQFREKVSAHQTKWRSERHTLMVSNQTRPHRYDRKRTCSCRFPMVAEPALLTPRSLSTAPFTSGSRKRLARKHSKLGRRRSCLHADDEPGNGWAVWATKPELRAAARGGAGAGRGVGRRSWRAACSSCGSWASALPSVRGRDTARLHEQTSRLGRRAALCVQPTHVGLQAVLRLVHVGLRPPRAVQCSAPSASQHTRGRREKGPFPSRHSHALHSSVEQAIVVTLRGLQPQLRRRPPRLQTRPPTAPPAIARVGHYGGFEFRRF